jgi:DNA mismatch endonuclease, patch repair protein
MTDNLTPAQRSWTMSRIKRANTKPELILRRLLHSEALRFRIHVGTLPGCPDVVFSRAQVVVFVDGDFWHGWRFSTWRHKLAPYWEAKIARNRARDLEEERAYREHKEQMAWYDEQRRQWDEEQRMAEETKRRMLAETVDCSEAARLLGVNRSEMRSLVRGGVLRQRDARRIERDDVIRLHRARREQASRNEGLRAVIDFEDIVLRFLRDCTRVS